MRLPIRGLLLSPHFLLHCVLEHKCHDALDMVLVVRQWAQLGLLTPDPSW